MERTQRLTTFDSNSHSIRVIDMDGEPWFPVKDVCDLLELKNSRQAARDFCADGDFMNVARSNVRTTDISFPNRGMLCVNESGLYDLIFESRKPEARAFRKWVTDVVLPNIRKNGGYIKDQEKVATEDMPHEDRVSCMLPQQSRN